MKRYLQGTASRRNIKGYRLDVHKESISIAVRNAPGKIVMECVIETKASMILQFFDGLRGDLHVTFEEGTWAAWLYDRELASFENLVSTPGHSANVLHCGVYKGVMREVKMRISVKSLGIRDGGAQLNYWY